MQKLSFLLLYLFSHITIQKEDPSTFSNFFQISHTNLEGKLQIDFSKKILKGKIKYYFNARKDGEIIILDSSSAIIIHSIIDSDTGEKLKYEYDDYFSLNQLGIPLKIYKEYSKNSICKIIINYETTNESQALGWFEKEMTLGKEYPYMFSQCQSIFCRQILPIQDTPIVKLTVYLGITVQKPLLALESGIYKSKIDNGDSITYFYEQKIPIPSYLIAIVAGKIEERKVSDRIKIYSEKENIEDAKYEFQELENYLQIAESYTFDYQWGDYNLLILPPSFPFGGMENPQLTFVTPLVIAGDRSEVGTIAHEMSHSWTGNLITNNNWENFWLNEGFTTFLERKILTEINGEEIVKLESMIGYTALLSDIENLGESKNISSLIPYLLGRNPEDAFGIIPYEKGYNFLYYIEKLINDNSKYDLFKLILKRYFIKFKSLSISSNDFKNHLYEEIRNYFNKSIAEDIINKIYWDEWMYTPGIPKIQNNFSNQYVEKVEKYIKIFFEGQLGDDFIKIFNDWHVKVKSYFLRCINNDERGKNLNDELFKYLSNTLNLKQIKNLGMRYTFFIIMLKNKRLDCENELIDFLSKYGIIDYLATLYINFYKVNKEKAMNTYNKYKSCYHPIAVKYVDAALKKVKLED